VDAEALSIVLKSGIPIFLIGWDVSMGRAFIDEDDIRYLLETGSPIAAFCVRCNQSLKEFNFKRLGKHGFDLPDPATVAAAIYPEIVLETWETYTYVETKNESTYGQVIIDYMNILGKLPNTVICRSLDGPAFKERLFRAII
jgi:purine nucleosidase